MKTILIILVLSLSLFADFYYINNSLSNIKFQVTQFLFIKVNGQFNDFEGNIIVNNNKLSSINGFIKTSSLFTNIEKRDDDLKSPNYFNVKKYKTITFQSISIHENYILARLNIKGIIKEIRFNITKLVFENNLIKIHISSLLNMNDFNLDGPLSIVMNKNVEVSAIIYGNKTNK